MLKPLGYDEVQIIDHQEQLPPGGYLCKIMNIEERKSKKGKDMIVVSIDIADGEYKDFFLNRYRANKNIDKKWPAGATSYILVEGKDGWASEGYKKFLVYTERSNNFQIDWAKDWDQFRGKCIGATFRREQFQGNNGLAFATKICWFNTIEQILKGVEVPADKLLNLSASYNNVENDDDLPF